MFRSLSKNFNKAKSSACGCLINCHLPSLHVVSKRNLNISRIPQETLKKWRFGFTMVAGAYIGGLLVSFGLFYLLYYDAKERQYIPLLLSVRDQINAVKAINKDDVLCSPRYAVKHYRRLLIDIAASKDPESLTEELRGESHYSVPIISTAVLFNESENFSNFYIDMVLRYAKALLAKGQLDASVHILEKVTSDDDLFFNLGDAQKLSQCCRLLSKVTDDPKRKIELDKRSISMLQATFPFLKLDQNYLIKEDSGITDELLLSLNQLSLDYARASKVDKRNKDAHITNALSIYLGSLRKLTMIQNELSPNTQAAFPFFNCEEENIKTSIAELKSHISEVLWAKGYRKNAISWAEEVIQDIYYDHSSSVKVSAILENTLKNLIVMFDRTHNIRSQQRCTNLLDGLAKFDKKDTTWYDGTMNRISKIMHYKGPLGLIEKPLAEMLGNVRPVKEIEEFEEEDVE